MARYGGCESATSGMWGRFRPAARLVHSSTSAGDFHSSAVVTTASSGALRWIHGLRLPALLETNALERGVKGALEIDINSVVPFARHEDVRLDCRHRGTVNVA